MSVQTLPRPVETHRVLPDESIQAQGHISNLAVAGNSSSRSDNADLEFDGLPPFPTDVPTAPLLRIELAKLLRGDQLEVDRLWTACCDLGFFYLDLRESSPFLLHSNSLGCQPTDPSGKLEAFNVEVDGEKLLDEASRLFTAAEGLYELPLAEKRKYDYALTGTYFGYKGAGDNVTDSKGTPDRSEFYMMAKDDILGVSDPRPHPEPIEEHRPLLASYIRHSHAIVILILRLLNTRLGLPPDTLPSLHKLDVASGDQVRWIKAKAQPLDDLKLSLGAHTDYGSVTVLFNRLGGLQILPPGDHSQWCYVKPLKGHAIVNLGDALVKFSAGILRSNIHRVVNPPGEQAKETRMSLVYFSRPNDDVILKVLEGSSMIDERNKDADEDPLDGLTSKGWILRRAFGRRRAETYANSQGTEGSRLK